MIQATRCRTRVWLNRCGWNSRTLFEFRGILSKPWPLTPFESARPVRIPRRWRSRRRGIQTGLWRSYVMVKHTTIKKIKFKIYDSFLVTLSWSRWIICIISIFWSICSTWGVVLSWSTIWCRKIGSTWLICSVWWSVRTFGRFSNKYCTVKI